jgi:hypothetical protein
MERRGIYIGHSVSKSNREQNNVAKITDYLKEI